MTWQTRIVALPEVSGEDFDKWKALADRAIEPNVYLDPRFLVPAGRLRPDAADIRVVMVERDGELHAVHQFSLGKLEDRWPARVVTTSGAFMSIHADRHHPLVAPSDPVGALTALLDALRAARLPGLVLIKYLPADGPLADAMAEALASRRMTSSERVRRSSAYAAVGSRPAPSEGVVEVPHLGSGTRKDFRRRGRAIERDAGGEFAVRDRAETPGLVEDFLEFQASGWKGDPEKGGGAFKLDPVHERWYRAVMSHFLADGHVVAPELVAGDERVFLAIDLVSGGAAFGFIDAYSERFARHSPGALGRIAEWRYILSHTDATHYDPAFDPYYSASTRLYPDRRDHVDLLIATDRRGRAVLRALPLARRAREVVRRIVGRVRGDRGGVTDAAE